MLSQQCVEKCHKDIDSSNFSFCIDLPTFFVECWGLLSISKLTTVVSVLRTLSAAQKKCGEIPSKVYTVGNLRKATFNATVEMNAMYIILLDAANPIAIKEHLVERFTPYILKAAQYLRKHYVEAKASCFQNILVWRALKCYRKIAKEYLELVDPSLDYEIEQIHKWTMEHYWKRHYFRTPPVEFCQKTNGFAIMFEFVSNAESAALVRARYLIKQPSRRLDKDLLFLIATIKHCASMKATFDPTEENRQSYSDSLVQRVDAELKLIEHHILDKKTYASRAVNSLYISCRLAVEKISIAG
jgi:hypothetical protein